MTKRWKVTLYSEAHGGLKYAVIITCNGKIAGAAESYQSSREAWQEAHILARRIRKACKHLALGDVVERIARVAERDGFKVTL